MLMLLLDKGAPITTLECNIKDIINKHTEPGNACFDNRRYWTCKTLLKGVYFLLHKSPGRAERAGKTWRNYADYNGHNWAAHFSPTQPSSSSCFTSVASWWWYSSIGMLIRMWFCLKRNVLFSQERYTACICLSILTKRNYQYCSLKSQ